MILFLAWLNSEGPLVEHGKNIRIKNKKNPAVIGWGKLGNLTVIESTGVFIGFHLQMYLWYILTSI
ncbi:MAG: hypothetical protein FJX99_03505 [Bacteroidetes bacterium]|nr:hypothetical protein [Bacteroidota bacterium]